MQRNKLCRKQHTPPCPRDKAYAGMHLKGDEDLRYLDRLGDEDLRYLRTVLSKSDKSNRFQQEQLKKSRTRIFDSDGTELLLRGLRGHMFSVVFLSRHLVPEEPSYFILESLTTNNGPVRDHLCSLLHFNFQKCDMLKKCTSTFLTVISCCWLQEETSHGGMKAH